MNKDQTRVRRAGRRTGFADIRQAYWQSAGIAGWQVVVTVSSISLRQRISAYIAQEQELQEQIDAEKKDRKRSKRLTA